MPVIERGDQPDMRRQQHPLPNTSPDMSPTPTTVKSVVCVSMPISRKCRFTDSHAPRAVIAIFLWS